MTWTLPALVLEASRFSAGIKAQARMTQKSEETPFLKAAGSVGTARWVSCPPGALLELRAGRALQPPRAQALPAAVPAGSEPRARSPAHLRTHPRPRPAGRPGTCSAEVAALGARALHLDELVQPLPPGAEHPLRQVLLHQRGHRPLPRSRSAAGTGPPHPAAATPRRAPTTEHRSGGCTPAAASPAAAPAGPCSPPGQRPAPSGPAAVKAPAAGAGRGRPANLHAPRVPALPLSRPLPGAFPRGTGSAAPLSEVLAERRGSDADGEPVRAASPPHEEAMSKETPKVTTLKAVYQKRNYQLVQFFLLVVSKRVSRIYKWN